MKVLIAEDDEYTVVNIGNFVLGFARHPAMGVLINEGGNDTYNVPGTGNRAIGMTEVEADDRTGPAANTITLGLFLDLGGTADIYNIARAGPANGADWRQTAASGAGWDPAMDFGYGYDSE